MPRIRSIKPEAFRSRSLSRCEIPVRWFFAGLWTEADDLGAGIADADILRGALFPKDPEVTAEVIEEWLAQLVATEHIQLYQFGGERYYQVVRWAQHQPPSTRRGKGKYPSPAEGSAWKRDSGTDEVVAILAARDLAVRRAGYTEPIVDEDAWLATAAQRRLATSGATIEVLRRENPHLTSNQIANLVDGVGTHSAGSGAIPEVVATPHDPVDPEATTTGIAEARSKLRDRAAGAAG